MKRTLLALLAGIALATGLACGLGEPTDCGNALSACSPIPPVTAATTGASAAAAGSWPTGSRFAVTGVVENGQPLALADGYDLTVTFAAPIALDVYAGCNTLHVAGDLADDRIAPVTVTSTALPCPSGPSALEQWLTDFFESAPAWSVEGGQLTLATGAATILGLAAS